MNLLSKRGFEVTGVDRSGSMLERARRKTQDAGLDVQFIEGDITELALGRKYDAVISMFAVMSYQVTDTEVTAICKKVKDSLSPGGLFIFDCWHGPAVVAEKPNIRIKECDSGSGKKIRDMQNLKWTMTIIWSKYISNFKLR
jgi:SAM-dependent methyltransferase